MKTEEAWNGLYPAAATDDDDNDDSVLFSYLIPHYTGAWHRMRPSQY